MAWTLGFSDFKFKFFDSALGYLWQLMRPLMLFGVLYAVFTTVFKLGGSVPFYPVALLMGIVLYSFFNEATSLGVRSLMQREPLVRKVEFPRLAVPLATTITAVLNLMLNIVPVFLFLILAGGRVRLSWLLFPVLIAALAAFTFGLVMLLSALFMRFRDIEPIWDVVLQVFFYASPIFYPINRILDDDKIPGWVPKVMLCNPFAAILQEARHLVIDPDHVSAAHAMGGAVWLLIPTGIAALVIFVGYRVFSREAPRIAEDL